VLCCAVLCCAESRADDQFRFLYFNYMNLALKTSLNAKQSPLTMEAIKLIRNIHSDFRQPLLRLCIELCVTTAPDHHLCVCRSSTNPPFDPSSMEVKGRPPLVPARSTPEVSEVCVKTAAHGWVVGRRATQTHREFFVLLDEKVGPLSEVQGTASILPSALFPLPPSSHSFGGV
jgi:hypothetical protein